MLVSEVLVRERHAAIAKPAYHLEIHFILEAVFTIRAVVSPVTRIVHVFIGGLLGVEPKVAGLTWVTRFPVIDSGHVLVTSALRLEGTATRLALGPVTVIVRAVHAVVVVVVGLVCTCCAVTTEHI